MTPLRPSVRRVAHLALPALLLLAPMAQAAPSTGQTKDRVAPPVIGIIGDPGVNVLHEEFATADGRDPRYPRGMPEPIRVSLPRDGTFQERLAELQAGPLGNLAAGRLYAIKGTRLLVYATPGASSLLTDRAHGTGTASAAIGRTVGSAPHALAVMILGNQPDAHRWLAEQRWIDVASISVYSVSSVNALCHNAAEGRLLPADGGLLFSSAGNTIDYGEPTTYPNGLPETYQVGGIDSTGRTWLPPRPESTEPFLAAGNVVRPYETGARYDFQAADADSIDGQMQFGGTSGATPTVAGYAAQLIAEARRLVRHAGGRSPQALASGRPGDKRPARGPLSDGRFTRDELVDLLHRSAVPAETGPRRYLLEGFGATDRRSHERALAALRGKLTLPERTEEQADHRQAEDARRMQASRCP